MNKSAVVSVVGALVPVVMVFVFGYWSWTSFIDFTSQASARFLSWENFNTMVVTLLISGFFAGMSAAVVPMVGSMRSEARKKREREKLKEEIRRELEMEDGSKNSARQR